MKNRHQSQARKSRKFEVVDSGRSCGVVEGRELAVRLPLPLVEVWEASKGRLTVGEVLDATAVSLEQCRALMGLAAVSPGAPDKIAAERLRLRDAVLVEFNHLRSNGNQGSHKSSTEFPALVTAALEQHTQHRLAGRFEAVLK